MNIELDGDGEPVVTYLDESTFSTTVAIAEHNPDREIEGPVEYISAGITFGILGGLALVALRNK